MLLQLYAFLSHVNFLRIFCYLMSFKKLGFYLLQVNAIVSCTCRLTFYCNIVDDEFDLKPVPSLTDVVIVQDLTASWSMDENKLSLSNISFTVNKVFK